VANFSEVYEKPCSHVSSRGFGGMGPGDPSTAREYCVIDLVTSARTQHDGAPDHLPRFDRSSVDAEIRRENAALGVRSFTMGLAVLVVAALTERVTGARFDRVDLAICATFLAPQAIVAVSRDLRAVASANFSLTAGIVIAANAADLALLSIRHSFSPDPVAYAFEFVMLQLMFGYLFSGASNRHASAAGWTVTVAYVGSLNLFTDLDASALLRVAFALVAVNLIGMAGRHQIEQTRARHIREKLAWARAAQTDHLTRVLNRRGFMDAFDTLLRTACREDRVVAVTAIDLDGFKIVNDTLGHANGDVVLAQVATTLTAAAQRPLDIVGRLGGDEFAVAWIDASATEAELMSETVRESIAALSLPHDARVTASIGVLSFRPGRCDRTNLEWLDLADDLARQSKRAGGDQVVAVDHGAADPVRSLSLP